MKEHLNTFIFAIVLFSLNYVCLACRGSDQPTSSKKGGMQYLRCADIRGDRNVEAISLPPLKLVRKNKDMKINGISSSIITLGVLSGINDTNAQTALNIEYFLEQFRTARVQAILVPGGIGRTEEQMDAALEFLTRAPVPILISPGASESFGAFRAAIKRARIISPQVVDMTLVRRVYMRHVTIVSLPGYYNPFYLEAGSQGCSYEKTDLNALSHYVDSSQINVLLSPTPPLGTGIHAPDSGLGNINTGDPNLTEAMKRAKIQFGIHGHIYEAGGNAVALEGNIPLQENIWHNSLLLQAGSTDAVPVIKNDGGRLAGIAHIVDFSGKRGRFKRLSID